MTNIGCVLHGAGDLRVEELALAHPQPGEVAIDVTFGGICGSDLHYYHHGAVGDFRVSEPLVLGHEVVGHVAAAGDSPLFAPRTPVAVHPATPCDGCAECSAGRRNICRHTRYLGSAAHTPHVQGGFRQRVIVPSAQVRALPPALDLDRAVLAEPLAVALHAVRRAGDVGGRRVLVTGAGPIGLLVVAALKTAGAAEIIVTDLLDAPLSLAADAGATTTIRADATAELPEVDIAVEASGTGAALATCVDRVRRGGLVVMLGLLPPGMTGVFGNMVVTRELELLGAFRFDTEFDNAIDLLASGLDVRGIITHTFSLAHARKAFDLAGDRSRAAKVLLRIDGD